MGIVAQNPDWQQKMENDMADRLARHIIRTSPVVTTKQLVDSLAESEQVDPDAREAHSDREKWETFILTN